MTDPTSAERARLSKAKQALLEARLRQRTPVADDRIPRLNQPEAPLSFAQQRLWFLDQFYSRSCAYNVPRVFRLRGELDVPALEQALRSILERHEILRTTFQVVGSDPVQVIGDVRAVPFEVCDLTSLPDKEREAKAREMISSEVERPFDLASDPMLRAKLLRLQADEHILLLMTHHIASDGWSKGVLFDELAAFYNRALGEGSPAPPPLPIQYADFARWQRAWVKGTRLERQTEYWKRRLEGSPVLLELPTDYPRPPVQEFAGATESGLFSRSLVADLKRLSQREGVTLFMTLLASFAVLLSRYSGQEDLVIGTPVAGRTRSELEPLIGDFVNMLSIRSDLSGHPSSRQLLARIKETVLEAYDHQDVPFESLVEQLEQGRDLSRAPIFQTIFILETAPPPAPAMRGLALETVDVETPTAKNDLILILADEPEGLKIKLEYRTDLFTQASIRRLMEHYRVLLTAMVQDPDRAITQLPLLTPAEREQFSQWNQTTRPGLECTIQQLFEEQCARTPEAVAVQFGQRTLSYRELNARANQLAHYLRQLGVQPDSHVGICLHRSPEMMIGLFGIMKAGGAYVPLDPTYPRERLEFMLEDAAASIVITDSTLGNDLTAPKARAVWLDRDWGTIAGASCDNPQGNVSPANLCYVIYTSGSTGRPKGVELEHRNVVNFIDCVSGRFELGTADAYLGVASMSFDASVLDFYLPLSVGARLVMVDADTPRDAGALAATMLRTGVTAMHATPSTWRSLVDAGWKGSASLKILSGGEALAWDLAKELLPRSQALWNLYGPTETAVYSAIHRVMVSDGTVLVGRPIDNTQIYILDGSQQLTPAGVAGEICIAGTGVAHGYWNRPELTAEKFVPDPFSFRPDARMYRTGDLGRYRPDGYLECLGRIDQQVKLRGFRIELGEIEAVLLDDPAVRQVAVDLRRTSAGDKRLIAYLVVDAPLDVPRLRNFLKSKLPEYMVPASFMTLEHLPLSPNGKLNRRALPDPDDSRPELTRPFLAPTTPVEQAIGEIFAEVLEVKQVGLDDDFFELGGHSLLATRVVSRLRDRFQIELTPRVLFESPTVAEMASRVSGLLLKTADSQEVATMLAELEGLEEL